MRNNISKADIVDILIAISIISRRIAKKLNNQIKEDNDHEYHQRESQ